MRDQAEKLRQMVKTPPSSIIKRSDKQARVIAITSGKGGVGKTNFTVNLALALAHLNQKVLVIDADLGMANVDVVLGCSAPYSILNLLEEGVTLNDVISEGPLGIKFMSGGSGIYQLANLNETQLGHLIGQITLFDRWADIILIDTGAGINKNVLNFVVAADEVIIITTPEPTAITDAYAMMKAYIGNQGRAPIKLVVNRVIEKNEGRLVADKLIKVAIKSLGFVYEDHNVLKAVKTQQPFLLSFPDTVSTRCLKQIAQQLLYGGSVPPARGIGNFLTKFIKMWK